MKQKKMRLRRLFCRLRNTEGMTLAETLMAVLLMSIIFTAVGGGVVVMRNNYDKVTLKAEAQVLLSTAVSMINADLESATTVYLTDMNATSGTLAYFYDTKRNAMVQYIVETADGDTDIKIQSVNDQGAPTTPGFKQPVVSSATRILNTQKKPLLYITFGPDGTTAAKIDYKDTDKSGEKSYFQYTLQVRKTSGNTLVEEREVVIRPISTVKAYSAPSA